MASSRTAIAEVSSLPAEGGAGGNANFESSAAASSPAAMGMVVPPPEAESIIDSLTTVSIEEIGSDQFMQLYCVDLERLVLQAHLSASLSSASTNSGVGGLGGGGLGDRLAGVSAFGHEYIVESILVEGKVEVLVRTLLAIELWRTKVLFPSIQQKDQNAADDEAANDDVIESDNGVFDADDEGKADEKTEVLDDDAANADAANAATASKGLAPLLAQNKNSLRTAFILHSETTIVSLLALIFYRREAFDDLQSDVSIALVDYCARCMTSLAVPVDQNDMVRRQKRPESTAELADRIRTRTSLDEISDSAMDAHFKTAVTAVSLARYLCEHIDALPLSARSRILDTHDYVVMIVPLIEEPPWTRRRTVTRGGGSSSSVWEKFIEGNWTEVQPDELLRITKCEAQPWLLLFHLLCTPSCREAYGLNNYRKEQVSRLRKFLNNVLVDQIPVLADVMRYMDELSIMDVPETATAGGHHGTALLMQQVDSLREGLSSNVSSWDTVAQEQYDSIFSKVTDATDQSLRLISDIYGESGYDSVFDGTGPSLQLTSLPIQEVIIAVASNGGTSQAIDCFRLDLGDKSSSTIVKSPHGSFRRMKCKVSLLDGSDASVLVVPSNAKVVAKVHFDGFAHTPTILEVDNVDLPTTTAGVKTKKEWRQAGRLEEELVVQLGFKLRPGEEGSPQWSLNQSFVSQPTADK